MHKVSINQIDLLKLDLKFYHLSKSNTGEFEI